MNYFEKRIPLIIELGFSADKIPQLKAYIEHLWKSNEELNLISRKMTFEDLIDNHIIDCLLPLKRFPTNVKRAADLGAGGGLPGVIYAIHFSNIQYILFEKSPLKQEFLNSCKAFAPNIVVKGEVKSDVEQVDLVTARGFKPIDVILDMTRDYYNKKGKYFLLKARQEKIDEEFSLAQKKFKGLQITTEALKSPVMDVERNLVLI